MAAKSKNNLRYQPRKSASRSTQAFTVLIGLLVVIMILLGLGILSLPNANRNSSKPNDLTNIVRKSQEERLVVINGLNSSLNIPEFVFV